MIEILTFNEVKNNDLSLVGGKGLSLGRLYQAGFPVPDGFVISTEAFRKAKNFAMDPESESTIMKAFDALGADRVAVRSSAIAEDSPDASWAGQFESFLNVTRDGVIDSVSECWKSVCSATVNDYAAGKSVDRNDLAIAVVVQKMASSEVSGVAFSVNPISKDKDEIMIEAIYGLGELLVQGMIIPDNYSVQKTDLEIMDKKIPRKNKMLVYRNGGNAEADVPADLSGAACLDDDQIARLSRLVIDIEKYYQGPQDIEWALEKGELFILQSRPITTLD